AQGKIAEDRSVTARLRPARCLAQPAKQAFGWRVAGYSLRQIDERPALTLVTGLPGLRDRDRRRLGRKDERIDRKFHQSSSAAAPSRRLFAQAGFRAIRRN